MKLIEKTTPAELDVLDRVCNELRRQTALEGRERLALEQTFRERFQNAESLLRGRNVSRYHFSPSGRVVWSVKGRLGTYQVIPETNFCSCDDYYFRVMDNKKQVCYHYLAQRLAETIGLYESVELPDEKYVSVTRQLTITSQKSRKSARSRRRKRRASF